ncbi:MAG: hypothetical protein ABIQ88_02910 [Chitinophagaceae bacterium]
MTRIRCRVSRTNFLYCNEERNREGQPIVQGGIITTRVAKSDEQPKRRMEAWGED